MLKKLSEITERHAESAEVGSSDIYDRLEQAYNNDRVGLMKTLIGIFGDDPIGQQKVTAMIAYRDKEGSFPDIDFSQKVASSGFNFLKSAALIKYAKLSVNEEDARAMVKAMLGSQLVEGWIVSESAFKKLHKTLSRLMHPDVFDGRAADAEEAGNSELANRIRENKEKGSQFYARLNTIKSESLTGEGDEKESGLLNGMDDMNAAYPLAKLIGYMLSSTKFPGFYLNDLAYTLVMIDKELPKRFKIGPEKFKDFFAKDGVSLDFEYISEYYEKYHGSEDAVISAFPSEFSEILEEDESSFDFTPYERTRRDYSQDETTYEDPLPPEDSGAPPASEDPPSVPEYDPSIGNRFKDYMSDFVSRFNVPTPRNLEIDDDEDDESSEPGEQLLLTGTRELSGFYKMFNNK